MTVVALTIESIDLLNGVERQSIYRAGRAGGRANCLSRSALGLSEPANSRDTSGRGPRQRGVTPTTMRRSTHSE